MHVCLCTACMPGANRRGHHIPWNWRSDGCEPPWGHWGLNPSPLEKQPVLLTTGPSLHSLHHYVYGSPAFSSDLSKHFLLFKIDMIIIPIFLHFKIILILQGLFMMSALWCHKLILRWNNGTFWCCSVKPCDEHIIVMMQQSILMTQWITVISQCSIAMSQCNTAILPQTLVMLQWCHNTALWLHSSMAM